MLSISCLAQHHVWGGGGNRGRGLIFIFHLMEEGLLEGGLIELLWFSLDVKESLIRGRKKIFVIRLQESS